MNALKEDQPEAAENDESSAGGGKMDGQMEIKMEIKQEPSEDAGGKGGKSGKNMDCHVKQEVKMEGQDTSNGKLEPKVEDSKGGMGVKKEEGSDADMAYKGSDVKPKTESSDVKPAEMDTSSSGSTPTTPTVTPAVARPPGKGPRNKKGTN